MSFVNKYSDRQNVLEGRKLIKSIYVDDSNDAIHTGNGFTFKMGLSPALEKENGLLEIISKVNWRTILEMAAGADLGFSRGWRIFKKKFWKILTTFF